MSLRTEILDKVDSTTAMPAAASRAAQLLQDEDAGVEDIAKILEHDPGLTANLLRLCNSPHYKGRTGTSSVHEAIVRLGMRMTLRVLMTEALGPLTRPPLAGYDLPPGQLWEHSAAVGLAVQQLARALNLTPESYVFTAGLLHDIGKIVMGTFLDLDVKPIVDLAFEHQVSFEEAERRVLGIDHAEVGAALLEKWNLPAPVVEAVRWHHEPENASGDILCVDLVHAADTLIIESGIGTGIDGLNYRSSEAVTARLGLNVHILEEVLCTVLTELEDLRELFAAEPIGR